jgi:hypothetical protein
VDAKTFDATLGNVERIVPSSSSTGVNIRSITRESLVQLHGVREDAVVPMLEVEVALNKSAKLDDFQIDPESNLVRCGVFHWVCTRVLSVVRVQAPVCTVRLIDLAPGFGFGRPIFSTTIRVVAKEVDYCADTVRKALLSHGTKACSTGRNGSNGVSHTDHSFSDTFSEAHTEQGDICGLIKRLHALPWR